MTSRTLAAAALLAVAFGGIAEAATPTQKCEASKNKTAGAYVACREKAEASAILKGEAADYSKCTAKFDLKWDGAESAGEGACPDDVLTAPMNVFLAAQATQAAAIVSGAQGIPVCGDDEINVVGEHCDGTDLGGESCITLGHVAGTLACDGGCKFDTGGCGDCAGYQHAGACWFLGSFNQSCDGVCAGVGMVFSPDTATVAGASDVDCQTVLDGLAAPGAGVPLFGPCTVPAGCSVDNLNVRRRCSATAASAADPTLLRACACEAP